MVRVGVVGRGGVSGGVVDMARGGCCFKEGNTCVYPHPLQPRRQVREEMRETWSRVYEQNYHKSLDHRSFYFKQTEKKNLSAKTMLQEIKEVVEKRRSEDQAINLISRPTDLQSRLVPDLTFDYSDLYVCVYAGEGGCVGRKGCDVAP